MITATRGGLLGQAAPRSLQVSQEQGAADPAVKRGGFQSPADHPQSRWIPRAGLTAGASVEV